MRPLVIMAAQRVSKLEVGEKERIEIEQALFEHCETVSYSLAVDLIDRDIDIEAYIEEHLEERNEVGSVFVMWWNTNGVYDESGDVSIDRTIPVPDNREL